MNCKGFVLLALATRPAFSFVSRQGPFRIQPLCRKDGIATKLQVTSIFDVVTLVADGADASSIAGISASELPLLLAPIVALAAGAQAVANREKIKKEIESTAKSLEETRKALQQSNNIITLSFGAAALSALLFANNLFGSPLLTTLPSSTLANSDTSRVIFEDETMDDSADSVTKESEPFKEDTNDVAAEKKINDSDDAKVSTGSIIEIAKPSPILSIGKMAAEKPDSSAFEALTAKILEQEIDKAPAPSKEVSKEPAIGVNKGSSAVSNGKVGVDKPLDSNVFQALTAKITGQETESSVPKEVSKESSVVETNKEAASTANGKDVVEKPTDSNIFQALSAKIMGQEIETQAQSKDISKETSVEIKKDPSSTSNGSEVTNKPEAKVAVASSKDAAKETVADTNKEASSPSNGKDVTEKPADSNIFQALSAKIMGQETEAQAPSKDISKETSVEIKKDPSSTSNGKEVSDKPEAKVAVQESEAVSPSNDVSKETAVDTNKESNSPSNGKDVAEKPADSNIFQALTAKIMGQEVEPSKVSQQAEEQASSVVDRTSDTDKGGNGLEVIAKKDVESSVKDTQSNGNRKVENIKDAESKVNGKSEADVQKDKAETVKDTESKVNVKSEVDVKKDKDANAKDVESKINGKVEAAKEAGPNLNGKSEVDVKKDKDANAKDVESKINGKVEAAKEAGPKLDGKSEVDVKKDKDETTKDVESKLNGKDEAVKEAEPNLNGKSAVDVKKDKDETTKDPESKVNGKSVADTEKDKGNTVKDSLSKASVKSEVDVKEVNDNVLKDASTKTTGKDVKKDTDVVMKGVEGGDSVNNDESGKVKAEPIPEINKVDNGKAPFFAKKEKEDTVKQTELKDKAKDEINKQENGPVESTVAKGKGDTASRSETSESSKEVEPKLIIKSEDLSKKDKEVNGKDPESKENGKVAVGKKENDYVVKQPDLQDSSKSEVIVKETSAANKVGEVETAKKEVELNELAKAEAKFPDVQIGVSVPEDAAMTVSAPFADVDMNIVAGAGVAVASLAVGAALIAATGGQQDSTDSSKPADKQVGTKKKVDVPAGDTSNVNSYISSLKSTKSTTKASGKAPSDSDYLSALQRSNAVMKSTKGTARRDSDGYLSAISKKATTTPKGKAPPGISYLDALPKMEMRSSVSPPSAPAKPSKPTFVTTDPGKNSSASFEKPRVTGNEPSSGRSENQVDPGQRTGSTSKKSFSPFGSKPKKIDDVNDGSYLNKVGSMSSPQSYPSRMSDQGTVQTKPNEASQAMPYTASGEGYQRKENISTTQVYGADTGGPPANFSNEYSRSSYSSTGEKPRDRGFPPGTGYLSNVGNAASRPPYSSNTYQGTGPADSGGPEQGNSFSVLVPNSQLDGNPNSGMPPPMYRDRPPGPPSTPRATSFSPGTSYLNSVDSMSGRAPFTNSIGSMGDTGRTNLYGYQDVSSPPFPPDEVRNPAPSSFSPGGSYLGSIGTSAPPMYSSSVPRGPNANGPFTNSPPVPQQPYDPRAPVPPPVDYSLNWDVEQSSSQSSVLGNSYLDSVSRPQDPSY